MGIKKWIGGVLIAALVAVLLTALTIVLKTDLMDEYTEPEPVQIADDRLGPLVMQKSNLFKQRERVQQEYIERIQGMGTVTLLFTQPDEIFMEIVVPMMEEKGISNCKSRMKHDEIILRWKILVSSGLLRPPYPSSTHRYTLMPCKK